MAITRERKNEMVEEYIQWMENSRAMVVTEYTGLSMAQIDDLRRRVREVGGEFHIIKNTLAKVAFEQAGWKMDENYFQGSTAIGFAFEDAPGLAKAMSEFARSSDFLKIKGGYLQQDLLNQDQVKALADLPPLPIMRAQLLGTLMAPASKLVRTLAEPGRSLAAVIKAHADKEGGEAAPAGEAVPAAG